MAKAKKGGKKSKARGGAGNKAFMAPLRPSEALAKLVGYKPLPRTQIVKKLWAYIKKKKLQNKKNLREIITDEILKPIFGNKAKINMFEMMKWLKKHTKKA
jgi:chromatin remodeling complex protein RSC6